MSDTDESCSVRTHQVDYDSQAHNKIGAHRVNTEEKEKGIRRKKERRRKKSKVEVNPPPCTKTDQPNRTPRKHSGKREKKKKRKKYEWEAR